MNQSKQTNPAAVQEFDAEVKVSGINPYVDVPDVLVESLGGGAKIPVLVEVINPSDKGDDSVIERDAERLRAIGRLDVEGWFRTTFVPRRTGPTRLYLVRWNAPPTVPVSAMLSKSP